MIKIAVNRASATETGLHEALTTGRVGLQVALEFSPEWRALIKTAVVYGSGRAIETAVAQDNTFVVPHECMTEPGSPVKIGICGMNEAGTVVIPTVYCALGILQEGAVPTGETGEEPTPSVFNQMVATANTAVEAAQAAEKSAEAFAQTASQAQTQAMQSATETSELAQSVSAARDQAQAAAIQAEESASQAQQSAAQIEALQDTTAASAQAADASAASAQTAAGQAQEAVTQAQLAQASAQEAAAQAQNLVTVDDTLSVTGRPADAAAVGVFADKLQGLLVQLPTEAKLVQDGYGYAKNTGALMEVTGQKYVYRTGKIPCTAGDVFQYHGRADYGYGAVVYYQDDTVLGVEQTGNGIGDYAFTTPTDCNYAAFFSYSAADFQVYNQSELRTGNLTKAFQDVDDQLSAASYRLQAAADQLSCMGTSRGNLYNYKTALSGSYNGKVFSDSTSYAHAKPIFVQAGQEYAFHIYSSFGNNKALVVCFDQAGAVTDYFTADVSADGTYATFTATKDCYVTTNITQANVPNHVFSLAEDFTGEYLPYGFTRGEDFVLGDIQKTDTSFFRRDVSINLLNLEDIVSGYVDVNKKGVIASSTSMYTAYIPIEAATYTWLALPSFYGASSCARLYYYDEDKNPLGYVTGTTDTAFTSSVYTVPVSFTFTEKQLGAGAVYVGLVGRNKDKDTNMFVRGDTYPEEYVAYHDYWCIDDLSVDQSQVRGMEAAITEKVSADPSKQGNVLYGKTAIFDGDSICASITDESGQGAWAGRIGDKNGMTWKNYAVSGGTITNEQYHTDGTARHWVCANVDTLYAEHPEADYIILEGGSNDADLIGSVLTDSPEKFGSYTMEDYGGAYDDTTFCGALETLFYKAVSYWPGKKLGFIVAYKMGKSSHGYTKDVSNRRAYFETAMALCEKWGVPCLNLWDGCCINPSLTACYDSSLSAEENRQAGKLLSDGQHPTSAGYDYITPMIEAWMRTL